MKILITATVFSLTLMTPLLGLANKKTTYQTVGQIEGISIGYARKLVHEYINTYHKSFAGRDFFFQKTQSGALHISPTGMVIVTAQTNSQYPAPHELTLGFQFATAEQQKKFGVKKPFRGRSRLFLLSNRLISKPDFHKLHGKDVIKQSRRQRPDHRAAVWRSSAPSTSSR